MRKTLPTLAALLALAACASAPQTPPAAAGSATITATAAASHPAWTRNATIYEVNVRQFTPEGTFAAFERHLPRLKALGVDILWVMPVQPIGQKNRKGSLGSYYAVRDYTAMNPEHGGEADFKRMVDAAHAQGMRVILDWVANHTAHDHEWIAAHPDWYVHRADGTISNARDNEGRETDWTDVAELNYDSPAMRREMIAEMRWWVERMGIDGFRCDVAGGVPMDFWVDARNQLRAARPDVFMLAEAESPQMHTAFDMTYGWELHHILNQISKGEKGTSELDRYFARQDSAYPRDAMRMYFTSNHDENSWQGTEFERMGANHLAAFYTAMLQLKHTQPALANAGWGAPQVALRTDGGDRVYAYTRTQGANTVLVAVNFGDAPVRVAYQGLPAAGSYTDWFAKTSVNLAATGTIEIPAHGYRVLVR